MGEECEGKYRRLGGGHPEADRQERTLVLEAGERGPGAPLSAAQARASYVTALSLRLLQWKGQQQLIRKNCYEAKQGNTSENHV